MTGRDLRQHFDLADLSGHDVYKLLSLAVQPRPIAWVSTVSAAGDRNLAPFSFFTVASREPATVLISIGQRPSDPIRPKDTLINLRTTGEMVVNIPALEQLEAVALSSRETEDDEFALAGLTTVPSQRVEPATIAGAIAALECHIVAEHTVGTDVVVYGEVIAASLRTGLTDTAFHIDTPTQGFLGRLAGPYFTTVTESLPQRAGLGVDPIPVDGEVRS
ncbi:MAG: flavin reductase family protein [Actinomycetota bacterium]|nr:flavin reductase family protein [Actinomycetota bacterium]